MFFKKNLGPVSIMVFMLFMAYKSYSLKDMDNMFWFYIGTAAILSVVLLGIYIKFYLKR
jgi:uncharacterized membrane protein